MDIEKQHEYLKAVNAFNLEHAAGLRLDFDELPELTQKILKEIKKKKGSHMMKHMQPLNVPTGI